MHEPYALEPERDAPNLPGGAIVRETFEELIEPLAAELYLHAGSCVRTFGDFHLAVSPGSSELSVLLRLMIDPAYRALPWKRTHVWMAEDAAHGRGDAGHGMTRVAELLGGHAGIPDGHLHWVPPHDDVAAAAIEYERELQSMLAWREKGHDRLDYALMSFTSARGLGEVGRPAGLAGGRLVRAVEGPEPRVALTDDLLRSTRLIAIIARGADAADGIRRLASGDHAAVERVRPVGGAMRWYLDGDACV